MSPSRPPVRIAVLGTGAIAQVVHLPILTRMRGVEVRVVVDADLSKATTLAGRFGATRAARSEREVWDDPEVDGVVICTPSHLHEEHVTAALQAGKYVLCEKPLALTVAGVERILAETGADDRLLVGMNQRFRADAAALKSFVSGGELGHVFFLKAGWFNRRLGKSRKGWRQKRATGGGALMDLGIQMLDLALWIADYPTPERISAHAHRESGSDVDSSAALLLRTGGDRLISLEVTSTLVAEQDRQFLRVLGSEGSGSLSPLVVYKDLESGIANVTPPVPTTRESAFTTSYRQELQYFVEMVRGDRKGRAPREHVALMRVVEAAYRSAEEKREITL